MAKIFEGNAYTKEIETEIIEINKENNTIELKDTIFYGKSGGQPGDIGEIIADGQKIDVIETIKTGGDIKNIVENINVLRILIRNSTSNQKQLEWETLELLPVLYPTFHLYSYLSLHDIGSLTHSHSLSH